MTRASLTDDVSLPARTECPDTMKKRRRSEPPPITPLSKKPDLTVVTQEGNNIEFPGNPIADKDSPRYDQLEIVQKERVETDHHHNLSNRPLQETHKTVSFSQDLDEGMARTRSDTFKYKDTFRTKADRDKLHGKSCPCCDPVNCS